MSSPETIIHRHHIIPKHMGGSNDASNLIKVSQSMHAFLHKMLWQQFGREEDRLAWLGLSCELSGKEFKEELKKYSSKKGYENGIGKLEPLGKTLEQMYGTKKAYGIRKKLSKQKNAAKTYQVTCPDGVVFLITSMKEFCFRSCLNYKSFHTATIRRGKEYMGYSAKLV